MINVAITSDGLNMNHGSSSKTTRHNYNMVKRQMLETRVSVQYTNQPERLNYKAFAIP